MDFHVNYAGSQDIEHRLMVVRRPNIPAPKERITVSEIPGREYDLSERSGTYEDVRIPIEFNYVTRRDYHWDDIYRDAIFWFRQKGYLSFSDDGFTFRRVRYVEVGDAERELKRLGKFTATFVCFPGIYFDSGDRFINVTGTEITLHNSTSYSRPVYEITGTGECTLTVNGKTMKATVDGSLIIDTELLIAYKSKESMTNTAVTGDYDDLILDTGNNTISVSEGFTLRIKPNWRVL